MRVQPIQALSNFSIHSYKQTFSEKKNKITFRANEPLLEKHVVQVSEGLLKSVELGKNQVKQGLKETIQTMIDNGYTEKEMSSMLGIVVSKVKSFINEYGLKINQEPEAKFTENAYLIREKLQQLADEGLTQKEIANKLDLSYRQVSYYMKKFNIKIKKNIVCGNVRMSEEEYRNKLQEMVNEGYTYTRMAEWFKCSRDRIVKDMKSFGIKFKTFLRGRVRFEEEVYRAKLKELADRGLSRFEIAKEMKITYGTISNDLTRYGIKPAPKYFIGDVSVSEKVYRDKLQEMADKGMALTKMAEEMHISLFILNKYLKKFGIKKEVSNKVKNTMIRRGGVRINREDYRTQLQKLTEQGLDVREISYKLNISKRNIIKDLKAFGIKRNSRNNINRGGTEVNKEEYRVKLKELADRGLSRLEIAQEMKIKYETISNDLKHFGIKPAQGKNRCAYLKSMWAKLHEQN